MRDLKAALKGLCLYEHEDDCLYAEHGRDTISFPLALVKEAIGRAIKAEAEVERLRKVVRDLLEVVEMLHPNMNPDEPCVVYEAWVQGKQALAEYDKTNISSEGE